MAHHWVSSNIKQSGVDDMVLLSKINDDAIVENLKKRFQDNCIYTYIGPVLIAVNPFKNLPIYSEKEIGMYQGAGSYENPPHIYSSADDMYRNMIIDMESHCVIISGESGAGKTVSAKYIMNYIARVSGGGGRVEDVKQIILESNPLLEAFGNAKTVRNNNSSRFGKYVEIQFSRGGQPIGGKVSQFLLEKSRVAHQNANERNFHIFYQIFKGLDSQRKNSMGLSEMRNFFYINQSGCQDVSGTDDSQEFQDTIRAMKVMRISDPIQNDILSIVAGVLHLGNVTFAEKGDYASVKDPRSLDFPSRLLGIRSELLGKKLVSRIMESKWGANSDSIEVTLNVEQATHTRDALAKALYSRMFDYIVDTVNQAMVIEQDELNVGILDIYGFEIFDKNGFEQFCINYVNEKLQQIFIELTLKAEQEEYVSEGIKWTQVQYFNNKIVCDMIEGMPAKPGLFSILDDVCATIHAVTDASDETFVNKAGGAFSGHDHFNATHGSFVVFHYAGRVTYDAQGFCERNRDQLNADLIQLMQSSSNVFIASLFPEDVSGNNRAKRPTTVGNKIRTQANNLVKRLMRCVPHYIRCIKPNDTKRAGDWEDGRVNHQVKYLGLKENIIVRRAGFAYRRPFEHFLKRYAILTKETWPVWRGQAKDGVKHLMKHAHMDDDQWQLGNTKLFVKNPESLFLLEESRQRKFDHYARIIQKAFRKFNSEKYFLRMKKQAADIFYGKKERHRYTLNRNFLNDYLFLAQGQPEYQGIIPPREKVLFSDYAQKYDRRFKAATRDLILTDRTVYLLGREKIKKGPEKGKTKTVVKRKFGVADVSGVTLSPYCDSLMKLSVTNDYDSFLSVKFKTEFLYLMDKRLKELGKGPLPLQFSEKFEIRLKKEGFGGGGSRTVVFESKPRDVPEFCFTVKSSWSQLTAMVGRGMPKDSKPGDREKVEITDAIKRKINVVKGNQPKGAGQASRKQPQQAQNFVNPYSETRASPGAGQGGLKKQSQPGANVGGAPKPLKPPRPIPPRPPEYPMYSALYDFEARDIDELNLKAGQTLEIMEIWEDNGWAKGRIGNKTGLVPLNYIVKA